MRKNVYFNYIVDLTTKTEKSSLQTKSIPAKDHLRRLQQNSNTKMRGKPKEEYEKEEIHGKKKYKNYVGAAII